jgi:hypothetical protein
MNFQRVSWMTSNLSTGKILLSKRLHILPLFLGEFSPQGSCEVRFILGRSVSTSYLLFKIGRLQPINWNDDTLPK